MRNVAWQMIAAAVGSIAFGSAGIGLAAAADMPMPQEGYAQPPAYYGAPPEQEGYAYPPPAVYGYPPPVVVRRGPYYPRAGYYGPLYGRPLYGPGIYGPRMYGRYYARGYGHYVHNWNHRYTR